jgi:hypothetical protein
MAASAAGFNGCLATVVRKCVNGTGNATVCSVCCGSSYTGAGACVPPSPYDGSKCAAAVTGAVGSQCLPATSGMQADAGVTSFCGGCVAANTSAPACTAAVSALCTRAVPAAFCAACSNGEVPACIAARAAYAIAQCGTDAIVCPASAAITMFSPSAGAGDEVTVVITNAVGSVSVTVALGSGSPAPATLVSVFGAVTGVAKITFLMPSLGSTSGPAQVVVTDGCSSRATLARTFQFSLSYTVRGTAVATAMTVLPAGASTAPVTVTLTVFMPFGTAALATPSDVTLGGVVGTAVALAAPAASAAANTATTAVGMFSYTATFASLPAPGAQQIVATVGGVSLTAPFSVVGAVSGLSLASVTPATVVAGVVVTVSVLNAPAGVPPVVTVNGVAAAASLVSVPGAVGLGTSVVSLVTFTTPALSLTATASVPVVVAFKDAAVHASVSYNVYVQIPPAAVANPSSGSATGGDTVTISLSNWPTTVTDKPVVYFGAVAATVLQALTSSGALVVQTPPNMPAGAKCYVAAGTVTVSFEFTVTAAGVPAVSSVTPSRCTEGSGASVTVVVSRMPPTLASSVSVSFSRSSDGTALTAPGSVAASSSTVTFVVPAAMTAGAWVASIPSVCTFPFAVDAQQVAVITGVQPPAAAAGTNQAFNVTLLNAALSVSSLSSVSLSIAQAAGSAPCTGLSLVSTTAAGTVLAATCGVPTAVAPTSIVYVGANGASVSFAVKVFSVAVPSIVSVLPSWGFAVAGALSTVVVERFPAGRAAILSTVEVSVSVAGVPATVVSATSGVSPSNVTLSTLVVRIPASAAVLAADTDVQLVVTDVVSAASASTSFQYRVVAAAAAAPTVAISPVSAPAGGDSTGVAVVLTISNMAVATAGDLNVTFNGAALTVARADIQLSSNLASVVVAATALPSSTRAGTAAGSVCLAGGSSVCATFTFTYTAVNVPALSSIVPATVRVDVDAAVDITLANMPFSTTTTAATAALPTVFFGGVAAAAGTVSLGSWNPATSTLVLRVKLPANSLVVGASVVKVSLGSVGVSGSISVVAAPQAANAQLLACNVTSISAAGGARVQLTLANFAPTSASGVVVSVGGVPVDASTVSLVVGAGRSTVVFTTPARVPAGAADIAIGAAGAAVLLHASVDVVDTSAVTILAVQPATGAAGFDIQVSISGGGAALSAAGAPLPTAGFSSIAASGGAAASPAAATPAVVKSMSGGVVTVTVPTLGAGAYAVVLTFGRGGSAVSPASQAFRVVAGTAQSIVQVAPTSGVAGPPVHVVAALAQALDATAVCSIDCGTGVACSVASVSGTTVSLSLGATAAGSASCSLTCGTAAAMPFAFTFMAPPQPKIVSITPSVCRVGAPDVLQVSVAALIPPTDANGKGVSVGFGTTDVTTVAPLSWSSSSSSDGVVVLAVACPSTIAAGTVVVSVANVQWPGAVAVGSVNFVAPTAASVSSGPTPGSGSTAGGTSVQVVVNFPSVVGGVDASTLSAMCGPNGATTLAAQVVTVVPLATSTSFAITLVTPAVPAAGPGSCSVALSASAGGASVHFGFAFFAPATPQVYLAPVHGSAAGGTAVIVTVTQFPVVTDPSNVTVSFGTAAVTASSIQLATSDKSSFTVISPAGAAGDAVVSVFLTADATVTGRSVFTYDAVAAPSITGSNVSSLLVGVATPVRFSVANLGRATGAAGVMVLVNAVLCTDACGVQVYGSSAGASGTLVVVALLPAQAAVGNVSVSLALRANPSVAASLSIPVTSSALVFVSAQPPVTPVSGGDIVVVLGNAVARAYDMSSFVASFGTASAAVKSVTPVDPRAQTVALTLAAPKSGVMGAVTVTLTCSVPSPSTVTFPLTYVADATPVMSGWTPASGSTAGGTSVVFVVSSAPAGLARPSDAYVTFGAGALMVSGVVSDVAVSSAGVARVTVVVPAYAGFGAAPVALTVGAASATPTVLAASFTYVAPCNYSSFCGDLGMVPSAANLASAATAATVCDAANCVAPRVPARVVSVSPTQVPASGATVAVKIANLPFSSASTDLSVACGLGAGGSLVLTSWSSDAAVLAITTPSVTLAAGAASASMAVTVTHIATLMQVTFNLGVYPAIVGDPVVGAAPAAAPVVGGVDVVLNVTNCPVVSGVTSVLVMFGSVVAPVKSVVSSPAMTKLVVTVPAGVCTENCATTVSVSASDAGGVQHTGTFSNFQLSAPVLSLKAVAPLLAPAGQAATVRVVLTGLPASVLALQTDASGRFTFPGTLSFGDTVATVSGAVMDTNGGGATLSAAVPALAAGRYVVSVKVDSAVAFGIDQFVAAATPIVTLSPLHVSALGGDGVRVTVVNIATISATAAFQLDMCPGASPVSATSSSRANGVLSVAFSALPCAPGVQTVQFLYDSAAAGAGSITYDAPVAAASPPAGTAAGGATTMIKAYTGASGVAPTAANVRVTMSDNSTWAVQSVLVSGMYLTATVVTAAGSVGPTTGVLSVGPVAAAFSYAFTAPPAVTLVQPAQANVGARAVVTASVANFGVSKVADVAAVVGSGSTAVTAYVTGVVLSVGSVDISLVLPASSAVAEVPVTLTAVSGASVSFSFAFVAPVPTVQRVQPTWDSLSGGGAITVAVQNLGAGLAPSDIAVVCGTAAAAVSSVAFSSAASTNFTFIAPPAPGYSTRSVVCVASTALTSASFPLSYVDTSLQVMSVAHATCGVAGGCTFSVDVHGFDEELTASAVAASFGGVFGTVSSLVYVPATATTGAYSTLTLVAPPYTGSITNASIGVVVAVSQMSGDSRILQFNFRYEVPAGVLGAAFGPMYYHVYVTFNRPVALAGVTAANANSAFACAAVLDAGSLLAIADGGAAGNCQFVSGSVLAVAISTGATLVPGSSITVLGGAAVVATGVDASFLALNLAAPATVKVLDSPNPSPATVSLSGPASMDACRDARLLAAASGVGLSYSWTLTSPRDAAAAAVLAGATGPSVVVPASAMSDVDVTYVFAVSVTDIGGHASAPVSLEVPRSSAPMPSLTPLDAAQVANVGDDVVVGVRATFSECGAVGELVFTWSVVSPANSGIDLSAFVHASAVLPAAALGSLSSVTVAVSAVMVGSTAAPVSAKMTVSIVRQPITVVISGGSAQSVVYGDSIALKAIGSDPDALPGSVAYEWSCATSDGVPCMTIDTTSMPPSPVPLPLPMSAAVLLEGSVLPPGTYVLSVQFLKDVRTASATVTLVIAPQPPQTPRFKLVPLGAVTDFSVRVPLSLTMASAAGSYTPPTSFSVTWSVSPTPTGWAGAFTQSADGLSAWLAPTPAFPVGVCVPGVNYTFTATVSNGVANATASTTTSAAVLPTAGGCTASPTKVAALASVDVVCDSTWTTPAGTTPLLFSFAYRYGKGDSTTLVPLNSAPSTLPAITISTLPPGQVFIIVTGTNAVGSSATLSLVVEVLDLNAAGADVTTPDGAAGAVGATSDAIVGPAYNASDASTEYTALTASAETLTGTTAAGRRRALATAPSADALVSALSAAVAQSVRTASTVAQPLATLAAICQLHLSGVQIVSPAGALVGVAVLETLSGSFGSGAMRAAAVSQVLLSMTTLRAIVGGDAAGSVAEVAGAEAALGLVRARLAVTVAAPLAAGEASTYAFGTATLLVQDASAGLPHALSLAGATLTLPLATMSAYLPAAAAAAKVVLVAMLEDAVFPVGPGASGPGSQALSLDLLINGAMTPVTLAGSSSVINASLPIPASVTAPLCRSVVASGAALGNSPAGCALATASGGIAVCACQSLGAYVVVQGTPCTRGCGANGVCDNTAGTCLCAAGYTGAQCAAAPMTCSYGTWGDYGACSAACGIGSQTRSRVLLSGVWASCQSGTTSAQDCNPDACPATYEGSSVSASVLLTNLVVADFTSALRDALRSSLAAALNVQSSAVLIVSVAPGAAPRTITVSVLVKVVDAPTAATTLAALNSAPASSLFACPATALAVCGGVQVSVASGAVNAPPAAPTPPPAAAPDFLNSVNFIYTVAGGGAFAVICAGIVVVKCCCRKTAARTPKGVSIKLAEGNTTAIVGSFRGEMSADGFVQANPLRKNRGLPPQAHV